MSSELKQESEWGDVAMAPFPSPRFHFGDRSSSGSFSVSDMGHFHSEESSLIQRRGKGKVADISNGEQLSKLSKKDEDLAQLSGPVLEFYRNQNETIRGLLEMEAMHRVAEGNSDVESSSDKDKDAESSSDKDKEANDPSARMTSVRIAVNLSFVVNVCLFVAKVVAAITSGSLSVLASALDSLLDLLSGSILWFIARAIRNRDPYKYPVSKSRLEPVGIIIFAAIMGMASLQIFTSAVQRLLNDAEDGSSSVNMDIASTVILASTIVIKGLLFLYCRVVASYSQLVGALADDHRNDVATNAIGITAALLTGYMSGLWWCDSVGAMVLSLFIIVNWIVSGKSQIDGLIGRSASPQLIGQLTFLTAHHDPRIMRVDKVLAYHFGIRLICEVDIVLPETMPLKETHDIGESLEKKIEQLEMVERAFVHIDYEWTHAPEHKIIMDS